MKTLYFNILIIFLYLTAQASTEDLFVQANNNLPKKEFTTDQLNITTVFPRNNNILYRGYNLEEIYSVSDAIKSMLGDSVSNFESPMFTVIKNELMGKSHNLFNVVNGLRNEYNEIRADRYVKIKISENGDKFYENKQAIEVTYNILNKIYSNEFELKNKYFNYFSSNYSDFPVSFLYSSLYLEVAKIYGKNILIFNPNINRKLDLNYYNKISNNKWVKTMTPFVDKGEFITPFLIYGSEVMGLQYNRDGYFPYDQVWHPLSNDSGIVFMKFKNAEENLVYIFDGEGISNIVATNNKFCASETRFVPSTMIPDLESINCDIKLNLIGILKQCNSNHFKKNTCKISAKYFKGYDITKQKYKFVFQMIKNIYLNKSKVVLFDAPDKVFASKDLSHSDEELLK